MTDLEPRATTPASSREGRRMTQGRVAGEVRSADGTTIAFESSGTGPVVILVSSALADRRDARRLAGHLASRFRVVNYDRRGRGASGDEAPPSIEREIDDIAALVGLFGGRASLFGSSSGAVLALDAANALGDEVARLALFEPPFIVDTGRRPLGDDFRAAIEADLDRGRPGVAVKHFMRVGLGMPPAAVAIMRLLPMWRKLRALAPSLRYDLALLAGVQAGTPLVPDRWRAVAAPTLVVAGSKSDAFLHRGAQALVALLPDARFHALAKADHSAVVAAPKRLAGPVADWFQEA